MERGMMTMRDEKLRLIAGIDQADAMIDCLSQKVLSACCVDDPGEYSFTTLDPVDALDRLEDLTTVCKSNADLDLIKFWLNVKLTKTEQLEALRRYMGEHNE